MCGNDGRTWKVRDKTFAVWDGGTVAGRIWTPSEYRAYRDDGRIIISNEPLLEPKEDKKKV